MGRHFDLAVIGSGPAGYVCAIRASQLGLKAVCIEEDAGLGGTCLNVGCIPSKTLLYSTHLFEQLAHEGGRLGIKASGLECDFAQMMQRKEQVVAGLTGGIKGLFRKNKIERIHGRASFKDDHTLVITPSGEKGEREEVTAQSIVIATGSEPIPLPFLPFDEKRIISSTGALALTSVPKKMIVVGAGVIGLELGSVYRRLGAEVTFIEFLPRICPTLDSEVAAAFEKILQKQGLRFHLATKVIAGHLEGEEVVLKVEGAEGQAKGQASHTADVVLIAIGRRPYTVGLNLEAAGISTEQGGILGIDGSFRTSKPHIYAIGDCAPGAMLAHKASEEGVCVAEIIAGQSPHINYMAIPNVVYTSPEVAAVGMTEEAAAAAGISVKTGAFPFRAVSRAHCTGELDGFVKIIADAKSDRLIGLHIICEHASEMIVEGVVAIEQQLTCKQVAAMSHPHPTYTEAIKEAALAVHKAQLHM